MDQQQATYRRHHARVSLAAITPELRLWAFGNSHLFDIDVLTAIADGLPIPTELSNLVAGCEDEIENESIDDWMRRNGLE